MFGFVNLLFSAGMALAQVQMWVLDTIPAPAIGQYAQFKAVAAGPGMGVLFFDAEDSRPKEYCTYTGVASAYRKDWDQQVQSTVEVTIKADHQYGGQGVIFYKKDCPEKAQERVFIVATVHKPETTPLDRHFHIVAYEYFGLRPDQRPEWLQQVMPLLEAQKDADPLAADVLASYQARVDQVTAELNSKKPEVLAN